MLDRPLGELFGVDFVAQAKAMGYETLADVLSDSPEELTGKQDFTYGWLKELIRFLRQHEMLHLLQTSPGRSRGGGGG